jgi:hypothetical protein
MLRASASRARPSGAREPVAIVVGNVERWVGVCRGAEFVVAQELGSACVPPTTLRLGGTVEAELEVGAVAARTCGVHPSCRVAVSAPLIADCRATVGDVRSEHLHRQLRTGSSA